MDKIFQNKWEIVQSLKDAALFKGFTVKAHTIIWPNGLDCAPEFIKPLILTRATARF